MTEKEKMLNGRFYDYRDPALERMREKAAGLLSLYNQTGFHERGRRKELLKLVLGDVGENCTIELPFHCDYGCHLHIGKNFYSNIHFTVLDCADVYIGGNVLIGPNVGIYPPDHALDPVERAASLERSLPVNIRDGVWIGGHSVILGNVTIGENTVIGAGSVVTKDIPANVIAFGNPCRVYRKITEKDKMIYT